MQEDEITAYLASHPEFFERNASLLADVHLPSPHGGGTISLAERQQLAQRDKISALKDRHTKLVLNAQENDKINDKMHAFFILLQQAKSFNALDQLVRHHLAENFNIADICLRIWAHPLNSTDTENLVFRDVSQAVQAWVSNINNAYCGETPTSIDTDGWFAAPAKSVAVLPLKGKAIYGYLALSSEEKERFYVGMGTDFLQKLGDHISAALSRHVVE